MKANTWDYTRSFKIYLKAVLIEKLSIVNSLYNFYHINITVGPTYLLLDKSQWLVGRFFKLPQANILALQFYAWNQVLSDFLIPLYNNVYGICGL